jgi:hypothetical protein
MNVCGLESTKNVRRTLTTIDDRAVSKMSLEQFTWSLLATDPELITKLRMVHIPTLRIQRQTTNVCGPKRAKKSEMTAQGIYG